MGLTGRQFTIAAGDHEATVVEVGAGLRRYAHRGVDVTFTYGDGDLPPKGCGAVLVPWPNRLRGGKYTFDGKAYQLPLSEPPTGNAIHGLGRWARWVPVRHETSAVTLALDIVPQAGWPFEVRVEVTYALDAVGGLAVTGVARNTGTGRAPFGAGFHPYLSTRGHGIGEVTVKVPARDRIVLDEAKVPVGMQSVAGTPYDLRRGRRLGALRLDDGFAGLSTAGGPRRRARADAVGWCAGLVRRDVPVRAGVHARSGGRRAARCGGRADDLPGRRVQFRNGTDRPDAARLVDRVLGHPAALSRRPSSACRMIDDPRIGEAFRA